MLIHPIIKPSIHARNKGIKGHTPDGTVLLNFTDLGVLLNPLRSINSEISKVEKDSAIRCVPLYPFVPCVYARLDDWMDKHSADCASLILICVVLVSYMII